MAVTEAAPNSVTKESIERGVDALLKWMRERSKQEKAQLLEHDDLLYLLLTVKTIPSTGRTNPFRIPLPHPVHLLDEPSSPPPSICLLLDDRPNSPLTPAAARSRVDAESLPVSDVIGLSDLRSDYKPYEARRKLCGSHDLFFADGKIVHLLPRLLGKQFFKTKKIPLPVNFSRVGWPSQIRSWCGSTLLYLRTGACSGMKVGRVSQNRDEIVANVTAAIAGAVELIPKKWANVRSLCIRSADSVGLPVYQAVPEIGLKIEGFEKKEEVEALVEQKGKKKKSVGKKRGRIHEVQFLADKDDGIENDESSELGTKMTTKKKKTKKQKLEVDAPTSDGLVNEAIEGVRINEGDDEKVRDGSVEGKKKMKKGKMGKDKKGKDSKDEEKKGNGSLPVDGLSEDKGDVEPIAVKKTKKKSEKDVVVEKEKVKKDKTKIARSEALDGDAVRKKSKKQRK